MNVQLLPKYRCHKEVWAAKIAAIQQLTNGSYRLFFTFNENTGFSFHEVSPEFVTKHNPKVGDYFVVYSDNYTSISPAKAFEEGYTLIDNLTIRQPKEKRQSDSYRPRRRRWFSPWF